MKTDEEKRAARAAYQREWSRKNQAKAKAHSRTTRERHGAKYDADRKARYAADPERRAREKERVRAWQQANRDRRKAYMDAYYEANRGMFLKKTKDWLKANPEKRRVLSIQSKAARRAREGTDPAERARIRKAMLEERAKARHTCYYCRKRFRGTFNFDHVEALARGGRHGTANLAVSCPDCNRRKSDRAIGNVTTTKGQKLLEI